MKLLISIVLIGWMAQPVLSQNYKNLRNNMVTQQLKARGIDHRPTLAAMGKVERQLFVPTQHQKRAYADSPLPIGYGQTISQPYIVAYMTELLDLKPHHRVLEIGTGSGYQAAVLAEIAKEVYTIEIIKELGEQAGKRLDSLGYDNVTVVIGDGRPVQHVHRDALAERDARRLACRDDVRELVHHRVRIAAEGKRCERRDLLHAHAAVA